MKVVFVSNYMNHYQYALSKEIARKLGGRDYVFVQTQPLEEERKELGWKDIYEGCPWLKKSYESTQAYLTCIKLIDECDIAIMGSAPEEMIFSRLNSNRIVFRYTERIYKNGMWRAISPRGIQNMNRIHRQYRDKNVFLLCASAYTACDMALFGAYTGKMYKWGYFPEAYTYDKEELFKDKVGAKTELVWSGRFIDWKHPEKVLWLASKLKDKYRNFHITMIGTGEQKEHYEYEVIKQGLDEFISIIGPVTPEKVRGYMERANIFLFTSDYHEGFGVVLSEAMNSGCAVVASHAAGGTPFLIRHNQNGLIYKSNRKTELYRQTVKLLESVEECRRLGENAYETVRTQWNPTTAAENLVQLFDGILNHKEIKIKDGPASPAKIIWQHKMFRYLTRGH